MKAAKMVNPLLFFIVLIIAPLLTIVVEGSKYETLLIDSILTDYDKRSRPVEDYHSPVKVNFSISLQQILQVDEKHQTLTTNIRRHMFWKDFYLKWNPESYGNISEIYLRPGQIWIPDIRLYNSASYEKQLESDNINALKYDGTVRDVLQVVVKTTCKIDVTWFPFDEQKCSLIFGSWTLPTQYLHMEINQNWYNTDSRMFVDNGEWKLLEVTTEIALPTYSCCKNNTYINVVYIIHLKRRALYYFFNLLIPCGLIGFLAVLGFTLPPESGEKLSVGSAILFSLIVFLNMIGESMPANSDTVPLLGTYFNCVMITIALSVVSTIVINLNLNGSNTKEITGHSKTVFLHWLPRILHMTHPPNVICHDERITSCEKKVGNLNRSGKTNSIVKWETSLDKATQEWIFIANVVERLCLIISLIFTFVSVTVFLIYAF